MTTGQPSNPVSQGQEQQPAGRLWVTPGTSEHGVHLEVRRELLDAPLVDLLHAEISTAHGSAGAGARHLASMLQQELAELRLEHDGRYFSTTASIRDVLGRSGQGSNQDQPPLVRVMKRQRGGASLAGR